jgi:hypothetical protein
MSLQYTRTERPLSDRVVYLLGNELKRIFIVLLTILAASALSCCGGKLAATGSVTVTGMHGNGEMRLSYPDGKTKIKRLKADSGPKEAAKVARNLFKPARFVETIKGGTLTFPDGDTVIFQDVLEK